MNEFKEPKSFWGGSWTEEKLDAFEKYVNAYLMIMNAQKEKYNGWPTTIYFDGFAGSGEKKLKRNDEQENLFSDYFSERENEVYKGSAERVLSLRNKFDYYYFVDIDEEAINNLQNFLSSKGLLTDNCFFRRCDVNEYLGELSNILNDKKAALVLLDPFGMQINWENINLLENKRVDLWILIPSGVIINRFLDKKGNILFQKKLESYFGLSITEIKDHFYKIEKEKTLFGEQEKLIKVDDSISKIAQLYIIKLKRIFKYVTENPLLLINTKHAPIYHFVFASNNKTALKIASQIIEKKNK